MRWSDVHAAFDNIMFQIEDEYGILFIPESELEYSVTDTGDGNAWLMPKSA